MPTSESLLKLLISDTFLHIISVNFKLQKLIKTTHDEASTCPPHMNLQFEPLYKHERPAGALIANERPADALLGASGDLDHIAAREHLSKLLRLTLEQTLHKNVKCK